MGSRRRQVILAVLALQAAFVGVWAQHLAEVLL